MTRTILFATLTAAATLALALGASADNGMTAIAPIPATSTGWLTTAQIATQLEAKGYVVREIEMKRGVYDVDLITRSGRWVDAYLDPATGESIRWGYDDDDHYGYHDYD